MSSTGFKRHRIGLAALAACGLAAVSACGSGSSGDASNGASLTVSGTAATGLAIAGQPVDANCTGGAGRATTNADGTYTVTVEGGAALPCVLRVTMENGEFLHSVALGTGSTARANITPVSELVLARLTGGDPASFFTGFDGSSEVVSEASVQAAVAVIVDTLKSAGIDLEGVGDVLTAELVAATGPGGQGNAFDQALDALKAAVEANGTTLAQLAETIANAAPGSTRVPTGVPSLPAEMLLKKAAANCPSFRSGTYRMLTPREEVDESRAITFDFDAATLSATFSDEGSTTWVADGTCKYEWNDDGGIVRAVVSAAGVGVLTTDFGGTKDYRIAVFFPEQKIPLADLKGTWNTIEWERNDTVGPFAALMSEFTLDADGRFTEFKDCVGPDFTVCEGEPEASENGFSANPAGGFAWAGQELSDIDARMFAYRAGGGELMLAMVDSTSTLVLGTKKRALTMNPVGTRIENWTVLVRTDGMAEDASSTRVPGGFSHTSWTITAVDTPEAGSFVRGDGKGSEQTLKINSPRDGLTRRIEVPGVVSPIAMMNLRGMGVTASTRVGAEPGFFLLSVDSRP